MLSSPNALGSDGMLLGTASAVNLTRASLYSRDVGLLLSMVIYIYFWDICRNSFLALLTIRIFRHMDNCEFCHKIIMFENRAAIGRPQNSHKWPFLILWRYFIIVVKTFKNQQPISVQYRAAIISAAEEQSGLNSQLLVPVFLARRVFIIFLQFCVELWRLYWSPNSRGRYFPRLQMANWNSAQ